MEEKQNQLEAARALIVGGVVPTQQPRALAEACEEIIRTTARHSLTEAFAQAQKFLRVVQRQNLNGALATAAHRVNGVIYQYRGHYRESLRHYLGARHLATNDPLLRARIDRALIDVYMYFGRFSEGRKRALSAMRVFRNHDMPLEVARTQVNYANLLHRQDRHRDAERLHALAAKAFEECGDIVSVARASFNRANCLLQLFEVARAEELYTMAWRIYESHGRTVDANDARYSVAWLRMLRGEFHVALLELGECEKVYSETGQARGVALCGLDRAEAFLALNLFRDARDAAIQAERQFKSLGIRYERAKAAYFRARAAIALGLKREGSAALHRARAGFASEKNRGFTAAAVLASASLARNSSEVRSKLISARKKFSSSQLPLWEAVCDVALTQSPHDRQQALHSLAQNNAAKTVPQLYAAWQTALGDENFSRGKVEVARKCWTSAADRLDAVRSALPPVDLRVSFGAHVRAVAPHERLLQVELSHNPRRAATWAERLKTAGLWAPLSGAWIEDPTRKKAQQSLDNLAAQVAALSRHIGSQSGERAISENKLSREVVRLQKQIRLQLSALDLSSKHNEDAVADLESEIASVSRHIPVAQFHVGETDIVVFLHSNGKVAHHILPGGRDRLRSSMTRWRFMMEREILRDFRGQTQFMKEEHALFDEIGEWIWRPLGLSNYPEILITPEGELANLPWAAIRIGGRAVSELTEITLAPSIRHYARARKISVRNQSVRVFVGAAEDLPSAHTEALQLTSRNPDEVSLFSPAKRNDWPVDGDSRLWHYAGHAHLRSDNPFYSYLSLADGPLFAADFRLRSARVELVTLAACRSGENVAAPGEESTGLVRSLLEMGARNVVAGHWPVSDESTSLWMSHFYDSYFARKSVATSARHASLAVSSTHPSAYHWAAFSVFGAGS